MANIDAVREITTREGQLRTLMDIPPLIVVEDLHTVR